jgi:hypothetical protein
MKMLCAVAVAVGLITIHRQAAAKEPTFPMVIEGVLPENLRAIATTQALPDETFALVNAPTMCLSRLSAVVDAAGGTERFKMYATDANRLNLSFQSYIDSEITFHCVKNDGTVPDRTLYNVNFRFKYEDQKGFLDVFSRVAVALYGWDTKILNKAFAACTDKAKRNLQKDRFGVIPRVGMVKGMDCYLTSKEPSVTLYAPDVD